MGLNSQCLAPQRVVRKNAYLGRRNAVSLFPCIATLRKSSPVSPPGHNSWQSSSHDDLRTPNGGRVSVTQFPEVSVNVSEKKKRVCFSGKDQIKKEKKGSMGICVRRGYFSFNLFFVLLRGNQHTLFLRFSDNGQKVLENEDCSNVQVLF